MSTAKFNVGDRVLLKTTGETGRVVVPEFPESFPADATPVVYDDDHFATVWCTPTRKLELIKNEEDDDAAV